MKKLRVLVFMDEEQVPPDEVESLSDKAFDQWRTEIDVVTTLEEMGHEVLKLGLGYELAPLRSAIATWKPDIAFNLLEEFGGKATYEYLAVSYLESLGVPYTGCNPHGLILAHDKGLSKKILAYHRIRSPEFVVFPVNRKIRRPRRLEFPLIVKSLVEEASLGIAQASVVETDEKLVERVEFVHDSIGTDAIVEKFIPGRELYVGVIGNQRLQVLPVWELIFKKKQGDAPFIATRWVKWSRAYQERVGIANRAARRLPNGVARKIVHLSKRVYRVLGLSGYARLDYRLSPEGELYLLEANPNPQIAWGEDLANSAEATGIDYYQLLQRILNLGLGNTTVIERQKAIVGN